MWDRREIQTCLLLHESGDRAWKFNLNLNKNGEEFKEKAMVAWFAKASVSHSLDSDLRRAVNQITLEAINKLILAD